MKRSALPFVCGRPPQAVADALASATLDPAETLDVDVHEVARR